MEQKKLYIRSSEFDFMSEPIPIKSFTIIRKGMRRYMRAELERPINIWFNNKLSIYRTVLLKPRYWMDSFNTMYRKPIVVNIAGFDNHDLQNFNPKDLEVIGFADLYFEELDKN
jgi:hypothetical protein